MPGAYDRAMRCLLLLSMTLFACGASVESPAGSSSDTGVLGDSELGTDGGALDTAPPPPKEMASKQKVTFVITNNSKEDRWLVDSGFFCTPYDISGVLLSLGFKCECECANPGSAHAQGYRRIAAGATYEVTWDARALRTYEVEIDCSARGWPGMPPQKSTYGVLQPVKDGAYTATFAMESSLPKECTASGDTASCSFGFMGGYPGSYPPPTAARCSSTLTATATFTLASSGDVRVPVEVD